MSYPFKSWVYRRPHDYRAPRLGVLFLPAAAVPQVGIPFGVDSKDTGWEDELTNTSDAELVNSVDVSDVESTWIRGP